ncbi:HupE/UreJ family protein [Marinomonas sp. 15G1-11]|uniref:HupE/UreJ family protein n=1 Tax=Marinomonas phaeophyticola TaxID=3004091 RepID=A0ABT4JSN1_9GAMM|nr:HupE/UreJ family protein [Marinomonas sp. 15G1-11]MCZ2721357.1 HupE/UreJ family protein [Marinomonas sp. 15G1-11]
MTYKNTLRALLLAGVSMAAPLALAHPGHAESGLLSGFAHPFMGLDHLIVMLAVGLWAARLGNKAVFTVPAAFVGTMILGCLLVVAGVGVPFVEQGIVLSVVFLGILLAAASKFSTPICSALVAAFAFFHGAAHGVEMPMDVHGSLYVAGFAAASVALHFAGIALSKGLSVIVAPVYNQWVTRLAGGVIALTGLSMAVA